MMEVNCEVIEDLLPLYVEDMVSESSKKLVKEHLEHCENCKKKAQSMETVVKLPVQKDAGAFKKISEALYHKKVVTVLMTVCIMLVLGVLVLSHLHAPIRLSYEQVAEQISVQETADGSVELWVDIPDCEVEMEFLTDEMGVRYAQMTCVTDKWAKLFGSKKYNIGQVVLPDNENPQKIYYSPKANGEAVCIYRAEGIAEESHGYMELPRLVLNMYLLIAGVLALIGAVVCVILRKKKKVFYYALRIAVVPVTYIFSSYLVLAGVEDVYNAPYYFSGILMVTVLLSLVCWWGLGILNRKRVYSS